MNHHNAFPSYDMDQIATINALNEKLGIAKEYPAWEHPGLFYDVPISPKEKIDSLLPPPPSVPPSLFPLS